MHPLAAATCIVILLAAAKAAAPVLVPLLLAFGIAVAFRPFSTAIARRGMPVAVSSTLTTLIVLALLTGAGILVWQAAAELVGSIPRYQDQLVAARNSVAAWLSGHGLDNMARSASSFDPSGPIGSVVSAGVSLAPRMLETILVVLLVTAFIQLESLNMRKKLLHFLGGARSVHETLSTLRDVQTYLKIKVATNFFAAVLLGLGCKLIGVSNPLLWGVCAFVFGFVPMVGGFIAGFPPILIGFAELGIGAGVAVIILYALVNFAVHNVLEPRWMGRAVGLSPLFVLVSVLLWGFVLGPIGALLAVPLTMAVKACLSRIGMDTFVMFLEEGHGHAKTPNLSPVTPTVSHEPISHTR
jgi:AI-2 transport protein TqsA